MHLPEKRQQGSVAAPPLKQKCTEQHVRYLSFCDTVNDGLQRFMAVTFEDSLHAASSGRDGLPHRHVQVVVGFLRCEVLKDTREQSSGR